MPQTPLYKHTVDPSPTNLASFAEVQRLLIEVYGPGGEVEAPGGGRIEDDLKSLEAAGSTIVVAVADERLDASNILFLRNCRSWEIPENKRRLDVAEKLWELSEKLVADRFDVEALVKTA